MNQNPTKVQSTLDASKCIVLEKRADLDILIVSNDVAKAEILLQGAQLISYDKDGEESFIWKSEETFYEAGMPVRGGVPLVGPWFSGFVANPQAVKDHVAVPAQDVPAHGILREEIFECISVREISTDETEVSLRYVYDGSGDLWDGSFSVIAKFTIGTDLAIDLEWTNTSDEVMHLASALHTYFAVSHVDNVSLPSFDGSIYLDALAGFEKKTQEGSIHIDQEVDRVFFTDASPQRIIDAGCNREIVITPRGSASAIVWNPWIDKAKDLRMFGEDEYQKMLCIETANVDADHVSLSPGSSHTLGATYSTQSL